MLSKLCECENGHGPGAAGGFGFDRGVYGCNLEGQKWRWRGENYGAVGQRNGSQPNPHSSGSQFVSQSHFKASRLDLKPAASIGHGLEFRKWPKSEPAGFVNRLRFVSSYFSTVCALCPARKFFYIVLFYCVQMCSI